MRLSGMSQLAAAVKESFATITIDRRTEENNIKKVLPSIQNRYIDSVEFSDRALELSMGTDTETSSNEKLDTDQGQEENPGANQQQPVFTGAVPLNVLA
ncbi:MAG: hypothetical protein NUV86_04855 [Candidatus Scalindua sp.]|nr:hypothetical protein [Candidatus Scalindua sp.]MCR4343810.1 hypothetical protein [Candidatus Scalindua sp.]